MLKIERTTSTQNTVHTSTHSTQSTQLHHQLSDKDISGIQKKLKSIKSKTNDEIKKELENQGIKLSGKSPEILKDIYMYSQLCGINIKRE